MHLINVIKDGELQIHIFNRSNFFYVGFKSGGTPDLKIQVYPLNSRGLERKQVRLQLQQHFIFRLLHLYTHYIINRQISNAQRNQKYTFPIKTRGENYTFSMKIGVGNQTFPKKAVFYPYKTWILTHKIPF